MSKTKLTIQEILDLKVDDELTIRSYLELLLITLLKEGESFSGKRPFGNSGWEYDLYDALAKAGLIHGRWCKEVEGDWQEISWENVSKDDPDAEFEGIDSNDVPKAEKIILNCIKEIFKKPEKVLAGTKES